MSEYAQIIPLLSVVVIIIGTWFLCSFNFSFRCVWTFIISMIIFIFSFVAYCCLDEMKSRKSELVEAIVIADATVTRDGVKYPVFIEKFGITTIVSSPKYTFKKGDRITMNYEYHTR